MFIKSITLKAKHFIGAEYCNGGGPIRNASIELFPQKPAFEGVEMSLIGGVRYYHLMYGSILFEQDKKAAIGRDPEHTVRELQLNAGIILL